MASVSIILCTYNSESYIRTLVDSILDNDLADFELLVQDDCSTDSTIPILRSYKDERVKIRVNEKPSGSAAMNFMSALLKQETAPYIMFADADDFWEKDKIRKTYDLMKKTESSFGSNIPILVHT
ncbi:MAG: glycosyltransferase, partial [Oscillospiraceae bacterium]|nr:glycosyltransferase [Oscillospiraceae bacterium]